MGTSLETDPPDKVPWGSTKSPSNVMHRKETLENATFLAVARSVQIKVVPKQLFTAGSISLS